MNHCVKVIVINREFADVLVHELRKVNKLTSRISLLGILLSSIFAIGSIAYMNLTCFSKELMFIYGLGVVFPTFFTSIVLSTTVIPEKIYRKIIDKYVTKFEQGIVHVEQCQFSELPNAVIKAVLKVANPGLEFVDKVSIGKNTYVILRKL